MGQYWMVIDLDTMTSHGFVGKLGECFGHSFDQLIFNILHPLLPRSPTVALKKFKKKATSKTAPCIVQPSKTTGFGHLPAELVAEIFSHIEGYADALCLGFTCSFVWDAGSIHIGALYVSQHAPLKGHRIMCIGDHAQDLPPSLSNETSFHKLEAQLLAHNMIRALSEEYCKSEQDNNQEADNDISGLDNANISNAVEAMSCSSKKDGIDTNGKCDSENGNNKSGAICAPGEPSLDIASEAVKSDELQAATMTDLGPYISQAAHALYHKMSEVTPLRDDSRFESLCTAGLYAWLSPIAYYSAGPAPETKLQSGEPNTWLLRNLSKKIYVRDDHLNALDAVTKDNDGENPKQKQKYVMGPTPCRTAFGLALFSNFCWSSDGNVAMRYDGDLHRGTWAGDAFDIVQLKHLLEKSDADQWKDNTDVVKKRMVDIWKSEFRNEPSYWDHSTVTPIWRLELLPGA